MNIDEQLDGPTGRCPSIRPIRTSWALQVATCVDDHSPGFLAHLLRSKGAARHAMLAVLANAFCNRLDEFTGGLLSDAKASALAALGQALAQAAPREALETTFGISKFEGVGTLERLIEPLEPDDYVHLVEVLSDPLERRRQQVLQHLPRIDHDRLRGILALDSSLCSVRFARKVRSEDDARVANDILLLVRRHRPDLTDQALHAFCGQADQYAPLQAQLERLLAQVKELPPLPFEIPRGFRHLRTISEFETCGRRFRNCLSTVFLDRALTGRVLYLEYLPRPAIAGLLATSKGYLLSKVHVPRNGAAPPDLVEEIRASLANAGIDFITPAPFTGAEASVRYALMKFDPFGLGLDEFDECAPELD